METVYKEIPQRQYLINNIPAGKYGEWPGIKPNHWKGSIKVIRQIRPTKVFDDGEMPIQKNRRHYKEKFGFEKPYKSEKRLFSAAYNMKYEDKKEGLKSIKYVPNPIKSAYERRHYPEKFGVERVPFFPWLDQDVSVDSMLSEDKLNRYTLIHELNDKLSTCRNLSLLTIGGYIDSYSRSLYLLQVQKAQRDYNEAKDRCKSTEWEDRKLKMKNENIDNIKVNHFGKFFYDYAAYPDKRYSYALINNFPHASIQYFEEGVTNIYSKIEEFCYLQALYCLLHDEDPIPPEFRKQEPAPQLEKETQKADSTAKKKEPDNYTPEERKKKP